MRNNVTMCSALAAVLATCGCGSSVTNPPPELNPGDGCPTGFAPATNDRTTCCPIGNPYSGGSGGCCRDAGDVVALNDSTKCCPFDAPYYWDGYCYDDYVSDDGCAPGNAISANDSGVCCPIDAPVYGPDGHCYPHSEPNDWCPSGWASAVNAPDLCCRGFDGFIDADGICYIANPR